MIGARIGLIGIGIGAIGGGDLALIGGGMLIGGSAVVVGAASVVVGIWIQKDHFMIIYQKGYNTWNQLLKEWENFLKMRVI